MASLAVTAIATAVIGAGVGAYGQYQQGKMQSAISQYNANAQERQAKQQMLAMQTQAALQKQEAEANFKLRSAEAAARTANAQRIEQQALGQDAVNRVNLRKRREDFARMQGGQRAAIAASGVAEASGTPLDLLAETAAKIQQDQEEQHWTGEVQRRTLFSEAAFERLGGKLAMAGATLDRNSALAESSLREAAAKGEYLAGMREAEITRLTGSAAKTAGMYQAGATLFSGLSSAAGTGVNYWQPKVSKSAKSGQYVVS